MKSFEFKILQYASSELEPSGVPFAVILYFFDLSFGCVRGFLLDGWNRLIEENNSEDALQVQEFIDDLEHYSRQPASDGESFFVHSSDLGVGPIRIASAGRGRVDRLRSVTIPEAGLPVVSLEAQAFATMLGEIQEAA